MITALTTIKGIDVADALARLNGKEALYTRLLGYFLKGEELTALKSGINSGNIKEAVASAHTLKGTAANLSVTEIQAAAFELERALKESETVEDKHIEMLKEIEGKFSDINALCAQYLEG